MVAVLARTELAYGDTVWTWNKHHRWFPTVVVGWLGHVVWFHLPHEIIEQHAKTTHHAEYSGTIGTAKHEHHFKKLTEHDVHYLSPKKMIHLHGFNGWFGVPSSLTPRHIHNGRGTLGPNTSRFCHCICMVHGSCESAWHQLSNAIYCPKFL